MAWEKLGLVSVMPLMLPTISTFFGEYTLSGDISEGRSRSVGEY